MGSGAEKSEDTPAARFFLFAKDDDMRGLDQKWCGVVIERGADEGEVMDAWFASSEADLRIWFDGWVSGWNSAEFHTAKRKERTL